MSDLDFIDEALLEVGPVMRGYIERDTGGDPALMRAWVIHAGEMFLIHMANGGRPPTDDEVHQLGLPTNKEWFGI